MEILQTDEYQRWFRRLRDSVGKARISVALERCIIAGKPVGDIKHIGNSIFEMRIHTGPGYRLYFLRKGNQLILLLIGGDKGSQARDIQKANAMAEELRSEEQ